MVLFDTSILLLVIYKGVVGSVVANTSRLVVLGSYGLSLYSSVYSRADFKENYRSKTKSDSGAALRERQLWLEMSDNPAPRTAAWTHQSTAQRAADIPEPRKRSI